MTLADLRDKGPPDSLRKLGAGDFALLWHSDFWDGPISGMLEYNGKEHWFEMIQENESTDAKQWYRRYAVVRLAADQLDRECKVHQDFQRHVGTHCDYVQDRRNLQGLHPQEQWHLFYDEHSEYCCSRRFEQAEVVAWFER
jgi:hypothetical protein